MATAAAGDKKLPADEQGGFFTPYKKKQGFWTRLGTGLAAGLVILFTLQFLYRQLPVWAGLARDHWALYVILGVIALALCVLTWWLINRPRHADFLIATDDEMKKVTWPGKRELIGSTKVVVGFMFFMAALLFGYDLIFGVVFWTINVLKIPPVFFG